MFKYDPEKILCDIKFKRLQDVVDTQEVAQCWRNGYLSEDGKTFYEDSHPDFLNYLLQLWDAGIVPDPIFEKHGGHFGRFLARSYSRGCSMIDNPPKFFEKILGGWAFFGNHTTYSQVFRIYTSDIQLAHVLLRALAKMYSSEAYGRSAVKPLTLGFQPTIRTPDDAYERWKREVELEKQTVTFYSKLNGFWSTCSPSWRTYAQRVLDNPEAQDYSTGKFASYFLCEPEVLGLRKDLDLGEILRAKLDDPNEYFNQILPWDYQLKQD